ncbi:MAG: VWA domain-containing protein, partial [Candidatus Thorarchaeota archaeon]|nr:VWA domain-containing protein [Candidatus Thorarchaeota archaeon]
EPICRDGDGRRRQKKTPSKIRNPRGNPIQGTICAVMMVVGFAYFAWLAICPVNLLWGVPFGSYPTQIELYIIDTILYIPFIYLVVRRWLRTMLKRSRGPAAGIDTVEAGHAVPEPGDEWGRASRPYRADAETKITGSKSELRESFLAVDAAFYVKLPDLDTGEPLFEPSELKSKAMIRSRVSSGGWMDKRVNTRAVGSLKAKESLKTGRPTRWRRPIGDIGSIHLPSTIIASITRTGKVAKGERLKIESEDIRESVFTGRTPLTILLVLDVSLSMKGSLKQLRNLLYRIERETRGSKDRVGIIAFKDSGAVEIQAPTTNWNKIYRAMSRLKISGLTPLAEGLMKSLEAIKRERMRNKDIEPLVIVVSDFAPNIPLAQSVGPGHAKYTPMKDLVKASRLLRKQDVHLAAVSVERNHRKWVKFMKRPYHEALELATLLRMRKEGYHNVIETILAVHEFRLNFGAFMIARASGGRAFLTEELLKETSLLGTILTASRSKAQLSVHRLREIEDYVDL